MNQGELILSDEAHLDHPEPLVELERGSTEGTTISVAQGKSMTRNYPNLTPPNDLRLPDALTIKHGPRDLLARFVLEGDKLARSMGIRLRLRHDFENFQKLNDFEVVRGNWYPL